MKYECCICKMWYDDKDKRYTPTRFERAESILTRNLSHGYCKTCYKKVLEEHDFELKSVGADMGAWR